MITEEEVFFWQSVASNLIVTAANDAMRERITNSGGGRRHEPWEMRQKNEIISSAIRWLNGGDATITFRTCIDLFPQISYNAIMDKIERQGYGFLTLSMQQWSVFRQKEPPCEN